MKTKNTREKTDNQKPSIVIEGMVKGRRVDSRVLEERLQQAVESGHRNIEVKAFGEHGIGGRLWKAEMSPSA